MNINPKVAALFIAIGAILTTFAFHHGTDRSDQIHVFDSPELTPTKENKSTFQGIPKEKKAVRYIATQKRNVIRLTGEVTSSIKSLSSRINKLNSEGVKEIYLLIDSPGGSVLDGALFISAIQASRVPVYTVCVRLCASMAAYIHQYGTKRLMVDRSTLVFHDASTRFEGNLTRIQSRLLSISIVIDRLVTFVSRRSNLDYSKFNDALKNEIWVDAESAVQLHLADELVYIDVIDDDAEVEDAVPFSLKTGSTPPPLTDTAWKTLKIDTPIKD